MIQFNDTAKMIQTIIIKKILKIIKNWLNKYDYNY